MLVHAAPKHYYSSRGVLDMIMIGTFPLIIFDQIRSLRSLFSAAACQLMLFFQQPPFEWMNKYEDMSWFEDNMMNVA